jgi:hypothetical protein
VSNLGFHITAVGEVGPGMETLARVAAKTNLYERFFIRDGILVGAFLINRFPDKVAVTRIIETKTSVARYKKYFTDFAHDIGDIPVTP